MSEATLTLRELFEVDTKDLSARVEPGLDVYQAVQNARQEIAKESRAIRWPWVRKAVAEESPRGQENPPPAPGLEASGC